MSYTVPGFRHPNLPTNKAVCTDCHANPDTFSEAGKGLLAVTDFTDNHPDFRVTLRRMRSRLHQRGDHRGLLRDVHRAAPCGQALGHRLLV